MPAAPKASSIARRRAADKAVAWIRPDETNRIKQLLGVMADDKSNTLWVCNIPGFGGPGGGGESTAVAFDLKTGAFKARHVLPGPNATCNDLTVSSSGKLYIAETSGGRIFSIAPGASEVKLEVQDAALSGIDGYRLHCGRQALRQQHKGEHLLPGQSRRRRHLSEPEQAQRLDGR